MQFTLQSLALVLLSQGAYASQDSPASTARQRDGGSFENPASRDRPRFRYWLPDASVDADVLKEDIKAAGSIGAGGVEFLPFYNYGGELGGPPAGVSWSKYGFGSPAYIELLRAALEAHDESQLAMDFAFGPNQGQGVPAWPGNEGLQWDLVFFVAPLAADGSINNTLPGWGTGDFVAAVSADVLSSKNISYNVTSFSGSTEVNYEQIVLEGATVADITDDVDPATGRLPPNTNRSSGANQSRLFAFYQTQTGTKNLDFETNTTASTIWDHGSYTVDHFSARGARVTTDFWDEHVLDPALREQLTKIGNYGWEDSLEIQSNMSWTPALPDRFAKKFGYDLRRYLPLVMFGNNNINIQNSAPGSVQALLDDDDLGSAILNDYRAALADGYVEYLQTLRSWVTDTLGLQLSVQPSYNMPMDMISIIPHVDAPESESLQADNNVDAYRKFAGAANLAGHKIISNEMGAVFGKGFSMAVAELLQIANRCFSGGVNQVVIHGQSYSGDYPETTWPGNAPFLYGVSDLYSNKRPDWDHGLGQALDYMARVQWVQRQGDVRTDVAVYDKQSATNYTFATVYPWDDLVNSGWTYHYLSPNNFNLDEAVVRDGTFVPDGAGYKAMVVLSTENLTLEAVKSLQSYAEAELPIIIANGTPGYYPTDQASDKDAVEEGISGLLQSSNVHQVGAGGVASKLKELELTPNVGVRTNGTWYTSWRADTEAGISFAYVFSDAAPAAGEVVVQSTKTPYVFDPWTGQQSALLHYRVRDNATVIPLHLAGNQSAIFAFSDSPLDGIQVPEVYATELSPNVLGYGADQEGTYFRVANDSSQATVGLSSGDRKTLSAAALPAFELGSWKLIAEHWEAPEDIYRASVIADKRNTTHNLEKLVKWNDIPELANTSGIGYYVTTFNWPKASTGANTGAYARFSPALNAILLEVNGQRAAPMDPANPVVDISTLLVEGQNELVAIVPSTMWNYIMSIWDELDNGGLPSYFETLGGMPGPTTNGLVGTASIVPFEKVYV